MGEPELSACVRTCSYLRPDMYSARLTQAGRELRNGVYVLPYACRP